MWKVLSSEEIVNNKHLKVIREKVRNAAGVIVDDYYITSKSDRAMIAALNENDEILIIREYRHGCRDYVWQLPAGCIDDGETAHDAARREFLEETGYGIESLRLLGSWYISSPRMPDKIFVFVASVSRSNLDPDREDTEEIVVRWVSLKDAVEMVLKNQIKDPHSCTTILWIGREEKNVG